MQLVCLNSRGPCREKYLKLALWVKVCTIFQHWCLNCKQELGQNVICFLFFYLLTVCIGGRCFNLYDVVSSKAKNDLAQIAQELKEKDMVNMEKGKIHHWTRPQNKSPNEACLMLFSIHQALVIPLEDSGFLILLHSSHLFSFEGNMLPEKLLQFSFLA